jgi:hypothetical protein
MFGENLLTTFWSIGFNAVPNVVFFVVVVVAAVLLLLLLLLLLVVVVVVVVVVKLSYCCCCRQLATFAVLVAVLLQSQVFWDVTPWRL